MGVSAKDIFELIAQNDIQFVGFRFTGLDGKWHHFSCKANMISDEMLTQGVTFDGSSVSGWQKIDNSDMVMTPDLTTAFIDPFTAQATLNIICDVKTQSNRGYHKDPRYVAKKAEEYLKSSGIASQAFFGPELEFFVFDDVKFKNNPDEAMFKLESEEGCYSSGKKLPMGNNGYRSGHQGGYLLTQPFDMYHDMRAEMLSVLEAVGLKPHLHHHEVASSQCELGFEYDTLVKCADNVQKYKYVVRNVALSYGKSVTFMPKPIVNENGSGMHVHQSLWQGDKPLFSGDKYSHLSDDALYYIGGIIKHAQALNAFTNPTTNSYKRLVPGYEAPVLLAYSASNRSASIRIPHVLSEKARRIEARFPDPTANAYLTFAALLMAGLDGIKNKIHPGDAADYNLYELESKKLANIPAVSHSLAQSLNALNENREFLMQGNVFTNELIDAYIAQKNEEIHAVDTTPNPVEFSLYYNS
jgi:glutamine synthetase